jgi:hypothetical protein
MTTSRPAQAWAEVTGGDALGRGQQPALSWWLPEGSSVQHAYQVRTDDGFDTGRVESAVQSFVRVPVFDRSRRFAGAQVRAWTDRGESEWSDPVALESGLLGEADWTGRWIGVMEERREAPGSRGAWWVRTSFEVHPFGRSRLFITARACTRRSSTGSGSVTPAGGWSRLPARAGGPRRHTSRRPTLSPGSARTGGGSTRACTTRRWAMRLLRQDTPPSWLAMVDRGATTMWEEWERVDAGGVPHASLNHYRPGGGIMSASARHISPFGPIEVSWQWPVSVHIGALFMIANDSQSARTVKPSRS